MRDLLIMLAIFTVVCALIYGAFQIKRAWNYSWGYESKVQWSVCDMVKPEALKEPEKCE